MDDMKGTGQQTTGTELAPVISHGRHWVFPRLLMVKERTLEEKRNLLEDVRLLNLEDRREVWRRRLEWWERKITREEFWTDWMREERKWVCSSWKYHDIGEGGVVMATTMISESITRNYPQRYQITFIFIFSSFPHNALGVHRDVQVRIHPKSCQDQNLGRRDVKVPSFYIQISPFCETRAFLRNLS